jgi:hypothetical protein
MLFHRAPPKIVVALAEYFLSGQGIEKLKIAGRFLN